MKATRPTATRVRLTVEGFEQYRPGYDTSVYAWVLAQIRLDGIPRENPIERAAKQFGEPAEEVKTAFEAGRRLDPIRESADDDSEHKVFRAVRALLVEGHRKRDALAEIAERFGITPSTAHTYYGRWRPFDPEPLDLASIRASREGSTRSTA